jgi:hypothetical protein
VGLFCHVDYQVDAVCFALIGYFVRHAVVQLKDKALVGGDLEAFL